MTSVATQNQTTCYHCGEDCQGMPLWHEEKSFCCFGCQTVYELLSEKDLCDYYTFQHTPGNQLRHFIRDKYLFLEEEEIITHLLDFRTDHLAKITFDIPSIHCSSCIWLLENIRRFDEGILYAKINFSKKRLAIDYNPQKTSLRKIADLLYQLSYEPEISLDPRGPAAGGNHRTRDLKIGLAGFCFGNIMLLAFPDYLGIEVGSEFTPYFTYISLLLSLPVLLYCAQEFFVAAGRGLSKKILNIDLPIAIGILALFGRSLYDILSQSGTGYLDSMAALVFFLLIGRWVQSKTYEGLSFDRNFKSYFPLAVQKITGESKKSTLVQYLEVNDQIEIRNEEIIPCDAILMSPAASIDYSFVSGESRPTAVAEGDRIFAGGKIKGPAARMTVIKVVSQSYLTQLWNHASFEEKSEDDRRSLIDRISQYFTPAVLLIALFAGAYWYVTDASKVLFVVSSVLIVACPCALALAAPFTLSATTNRLGAHKMFLKNSQVIEKIWDLSRIVFDKTGTLTTSNQQTINWQGRPLKHTEWLGIKALSNQSMHPLSQQISAYIQIQGPADVIADFEEIKGQGISGTVNQLSIRMGAPTFAGTSPADFTVGTVVVVNIDEEVVGHFALKNHYRSGLKSWLTELSKKYRFAVLSGDQAAEQARLADFFPPDTPMDFALSPAQKLEAIQKYEALDKTMMVGDGLNDAGALKASHVGISIAENMSGFTPASDVILLGDQLALLPRFMTLIRQSRSVIICGFIISFLYNIIGLALAVAGLITPVIAAILMPISSISVVAFSTLSIRWLSRRLTSQQ